MGYFNSSRMNHFSVSPTPGGRFDNGYSNWSIGGARSRWGRGDDWQPMGHYDSPNASLYAYPRHSGYGYGHGGYGYGGYGHCGHGYNRPYAYVEGGDITHWFTGIGQGIKNLFGGGRDERYGPPQQYAPEYTPEPARPYSAKSFVSSGGAQSEAQDLKAVLGAAIYEADLQNRIHRNPSGQENDVNALISLIRPGVAADLVENESVHKNGNKNRLPAISTQEASDALAAAWKAAGSDERNLQQIAGIWKNAAILPHGLERDQYLVNALRNSYHSWTGAEMGVEMPQDVVNNRMPPRSMAVPEQRTVPMTAEREDKGFWASIKESFTGARVEDGNGQKPNIPTDNAHRDLRPIHRQ